MVLLVSNCARRQECADELGRALGERVLLVESEHDGVRLLGADESNLESVSAIVLDEVFLNAFPKVTEDLLSRAATAAPIMINPAIYGLPRVVREVRRALDRHRHEQLAAMEAAQAMLRSELKTMITGILLASQLALETPALPAPAHAKLRDICNLAQQLNARLEPAEQRANGARKQRLKFGGARVAPR
jgi:signal transduction histidine kinase